MTYKFTKETLRLMGLVLEENCGGNKSDFARKCGIEVSYINRYFNGVIKSVHKDTYERLCLYIPELIGTFKNDKNKSTTIGIQGDVTGSTVNGMTVIGSVEKLNDYPRSTFADCVNILIDRLIDDEEIDNDVKIQMMRFLKAQK